MDWDSVAKEAGIRSFVRVNQKIRVPKIRCVAADGNMLGIMSTRDALIQAQAQGLDLVEISPNADPPVCRMMDFGKFRYEEARKEKLARKHQHQQAVKEMKFHANTAEHDFVTKMSHIKEFLDKGHKVKVTLTFRGRENAHKELGFQLMTRVLKDCESVSIVDMTPRMLGRSIIAMIGPRAGTVVAKAKPAQQYSDAPKVHVPKPPQAAGMPAAMAVAMSAAVAAAAPASVPVVAPVEAPVNTPANVPAEAESQAKPESLPQPKE